MQARVNVDGNTYVGTVIGIFADEYEIRIARHTTVYRHLDEIEILETNDER